MYIFVVVDDVVVHDGVDDSVVNKYVDNLNILIMMYMMRKINTCVYKVT